MSTVDSIFNTVIFYFLSVVFSFNIVECYNPLSKLDLTTLRQGSSERKNPRDHIENPTLDWIYPLSYGISWQIQNFNPYKLQILASSKNIGKTSTLKKECGGMCWKFVAYWD